MTEPARATCPQCGGDFTDGSVCSYCHQGLRFAGEGFAFTKSDIACPECSEDLHQIDYHGVTIDTCGRCEGAWFDLGEIEQVIQAARSDAKTNSFVATPAEAGGAVTATTPRNRAYLACPRCAKMMNRKNWDHRSGIIVDWCKSCGVWLDGGELAQMRSWGAQTPDGAPPPPVEPAPRPRAPDVQSVWSQPVQGYGSFGGGMGLPGQGGGGLGGLLASLLFGLFG